MIQELEKEISKLKEKSFTLYFAVYDTKGKPSTSLSYIYRTAKQLNELGYNVAMLYAEQDFVGVEGWLGKEYAELPHKNMSDEKETITISPSDFLFIPEIYQGIFTKTKNLPCRRIAIIQNYKYLTDSIPAGVSFDDLNIRECIVPSNAMAKRIKSVFPYLKIHIVRPYITDDFTKVEVKKPIINVIIDEQVDANEIIKAFYWKYPIYSWIPFRPVNNLPHEEYVKALKESFATLWCDTRTEFGNVALESMKCGNLVIGKVPENDIDWLYEKDGSIKQNGLWFLKNDDAQEAIAAAIQTFLTEAVPAEVFNKMEDTVSVYTKEGQLSDIKEVYEKNIFENRQKELEVLLGNLNSKNSEEK